MRDFTHVVVVKSGTVSDFGDFVNFDSEVKGTFAITDHLDMESVLDLRVIADIVDTCSAGDVLYIKVEFWQYPGGSAENTGVVANQELDFVVHKIVSRDTVDVLVFIGQEEATILVSGLVEN